MSAVRHQLCALNERSARGLGHLIERGQSDLCSGLQPWGQRQASAQVTEVTAQSGSQYEQSSWLSGKKNILLMGVLVCKKNSHSDEGKSFQSQAEQGQGDQQISKQRRKRPG